MTLTLSIRMTLTLSIMFFFMFFFIYDPAAVRCGVGLRNTVGVMDFVGGDVREL